MIKREKVDRAIDISILVGLVRLEHGDLTIKEIASKINCSETLLNEIYGDDQETISNISDNTYNTILNNLNKLLDKAGPSLEKEN